MDTSTQLAKPVSSVDARGMRRASAPNSAECFLTYANQLVERILIDYQIEISRDADCTVL